ncbi:MAG: tyrosine-type recombinase/integrase [Georgfuchsia sp.]
MFDTLFNSISTQTRYRTAPLLEERERYLHYCAEGGSTLISQRERAFAMILLAEQMTPNDFGRIGIERLREILLRGDPTIGPRTVFNYVGKVRPWLKFLGWWDFAKPPVAFEQDLDRFVAWMRDERGLAPCTVDQWRSRTATFLRWCNDTGRTLRSLSPEDIDAYFVSNAATRWSRVSAGHIARMLRVFLRHAESIGSCRSGLAESILTHRRYRLETLPHALNWSDVRRLIDTASGDTEHDVRDRAILLLLAVYGLRGGEVAALRLDDIDRSAGILRIWRLKRREPQVYPLAPSVGQALARYIDTARPPVAHREIFIREVAPRMPVSTSCISMVVRNRLRTLDVRVAHLGCHALRHACAVKMLTDEFTLKEIGDHLGHRSTMSTMTYTKVDLVGLRQIAEFDLGGLQ